MMWADVLNAILEMGIAVGIVFSIKKLWHDKKVRGISTVLVGSAVAVGFWNLIYFVAMHSPWSFYVGVLITVLNTLYLLMLMFYQYKERHALGDRDKTWCETYTGRKFFILDPRPEMIAIRDVAHSLSNTCRYNGHTTRFFSVAEHCCLLADYCLTQGWGAQRALQALVHDAGEAYIGDQPRPFKCALPVLKDIEERMDAVVIPALGGAYPKPKWLDEIDARIIKDERAQCRLPSTNQWVHDRLEPLGVTLKFWEPHQAETEWLQRYDALSREMAVGSA